MYTTSGLRGSNAMVEMDRFGRKSWFARHVVPASSVIHSPPEAVPASSRLALRGSNASARTRPATFEGPSACHWEGCRPAAFATDSVSRTSDWRCSCARRIRAAEGGPFSSDSTIRLYSAEIGPLSRSPITRCCSRIARSRSRSRTNGYPAKGCGDGAGATAAQPAIASAARAMAILTAARARCRRGAPSRRTPASSPLPGDGGPSRRRCSRPSCPNRDRSGAGLAGTTGRRSTP